MARIVVMGAGAGGLGVALFAGRAGHQVTLIERDDTPLPADPSGAFDWERRGAPQVRHSHAFLARLRNLLRDRHPDVLEALFAAGATPMDFLEMLPDGMDRTRQPGDEDLVAIACRRSTFEWVLRNLVLNESSAELVHGRAVTDLLVADHGGPTDRPGAGTAGGTPTVNGVRLDDGTELPADVVVICGGRRNDLPGMLAAHGVHLEEQEEDTGIVYFSRFFELLPGAEFPAQVGPVGGDLGYLKYGVFAGDNRTFSVTLASASDDDEIRRALMDPEQFLRIAAAIPATSTHVEADRARAITDVNLMAGLINRRRDFLADGAPIVLGVHAVGDAHTCTNPMYGRGCSLALVQADLLTTALGEHGDPTSRAIAYERSCETEILPWHRASVAQDRLNRSAHTASSAAESSAAESSAAESSADADTSSDNTSSDNTSADDFARELIRDGLFPAVRTDPVVLRAFLRMFNLLEPPDSIMSNSDVAGRVMQTFIERDQRPPEAPLGPGRAEILALR